MEDKRLSVDVHDYGLLLVELITGKVANCFPHESEGQSLIDWVRCLHFLTVLRSFNMKMFMHCTVIRRQMCILGSF